MVQVDRLIEFRPFLPKQRCEHPVRLDETKVSTRRWCHSCAFTKSVPNFDSRKKIETQLTIRVRTGLDVSETHLVGVLVVVRQLYMCCIYSSSRCVHAHIFLAVMERCLEAHMADWSMMYTSYTRCTSVARFDDGSEMDVSQVPQQLHALSKDQPYEFNLEWAELVQRGFHLELERLDTNHDFATMHMRLSVDRRTKCFAAYHMRHTIYDWNYLECANCGKTATSSCGKCKRERYCGKQCQESRWSLHERNCRTSECECDDGR